MKKTYQSPLFGIELTNYLDVMTVSYVGEDNVGLLPNNYWGGALNED